VDTTLAVVDLEFDSDIYVSRSVNCGGFDCSAQDGINTSCFCNYASVDNCGYVPPECNITCGILNSKMCEDHFCRTSIMLFLLSGWHSLV
jgi:hypothetical protein